MDTSTPSRDLERKQVIRDWKRPGDKKEVKSFLQTVAFCRVFMKPAQGRTYADVTAPLRQMTCDRAVRGELQRTEAVVDVRQGQKNQSIL